MNFKNKALIFLLSFMFITSCGIDNIASLNNKKGADSSNNKNGPAKANNALGFKPLGFSTPISFEHIKEVKLKCYSDISCLINVTEDLTNFSYSFDMTFGPPGKIIILNLKISKEDLIVLLVDSLELTEADAKKYLDTAEVELTGNFLRHLVITYDQGTVFNITSDNDATAKGSLINSLNTLKQYMNGVEQQKELQDAINVLSGLEKFDLNSIIAKLHPDDKKTVEEFINKIKAYKFQVQKQNNKLTLSYKSNAGKDCKLEISSGGLGNIEFNIIKNNIHFKARDGSQCN